MSFGVVRDFDPLVTGHLCTKKTILDTPRQKTVTAEWLLMARETDPTIKHTIGVPPKCPPHVAMINFGNTCKVYVSFLSQGMQLSPTDAGWMIRGAKTVVIGLLSAIDGAQAPADGSKNALGQVTGGGARQGFAP